MKRYPYLLLISLILISLSITGCSERNTSSAYYPSAEPVSSPTALPGTEAAQALNSNISPAGLSTTPAASGQEQSLYVRGNTITLGESTDSLLKTLGSPTRIDTSEYGFSYYIYNSDYSRLAFIAVDNGKVVGFYTDSLDFNYDNIVSGSSLNTVNQSLNSNFTLEEILTKSMNNYTLHIFMDTVDTHEVTGIEILPAVAGLTDYSDAVRKNMEQRIFDLINSIRIRNQLSQLSWSSSVALAARKHSIDMSGNNYLDHEGPSGDTLNDRLNIEGIYYLDCDENIIAGYGSAILSTHACFNSSEQRKLLLNKDFRYMGAGFAYNQGSTYKTYITQVFYR